MGDDLRQVLHELTPGTVSQFDEVTPLMAPRHMGGKGRMARALRWFKSVRGSDGSTSSTVPLRKASEVHETPGTSLGETERKSVAILPFRNLSNDIEMNFYEFSLADAVITELARVRSLVVRPSSVIIRFRDSRLIRWKWAPT